MREERVHEAAMSFACEGEELVGVLSMPVQAPSGMESDLALLVVVGGPQVRTGSHRQFTTLCRALAAAGVPAMRFDVRGMGDSSGPLRSFEHIGPDIGAALDALQARLPQVRRVVLWGLCDGASAALMYLHARQALYRPEALIAGLVLLNPWVRSKQTLARAHMKHYYWSRLRQGGFWAKLMRGGVAAQAARDLLGNLRTALGGVSAAPAEAGTAAALPFQERMLCGARCFNGPALWVLSGRDYTAKEFEELLVTDGRWKAVLERPMAKRLDMTEADHTFSSGSDALALLAATVQWLREALAAHRA